MPHIRRDPPHALTNDNPLLAAAIAALREMPPAALAVHVKTWSELARWPARRRAVHYRLLNPDATDASIAAAVGVERKTLYTWPEYRRAKEALKPSPTLPPRGSVDADGHIEAFYE